MKVWRVSYQSHEYGRLWAWHASKREAMRAAAQLKELGEVVGACDIAPFDIPTHKAGLLSFLNLYAPDGND